MVYAIQIPARYRLYGMMCVENIAKATALRLLSEDGYKTAPHRLSQTCPITQSALLYQVPVGTTVSISITIAGSFLVVAITCSSRSLSKCNNRNRTKCY